MDLRVSADVILRLPAALVVIGMLALVVVGDFMFPEVPRNEELRSYAVMVAVGAPFLLPWSWAGTRLRWRMLLSWMGIAALITTVRTIRLLVWFYPRRPFGIWLLLQALSFMLTAPLWLAFAAAWRRRSPPAS